MREASERAPLSETWGANRQAQKRAVDGSFYGDYDGIGALANSSSGFGGLGRLGRSEGAWSGASGASVCCGSALLAAPQLAIARHRSCWG